MGVDYVVDLPCPVKSDLPTPKLVDLIKSRNTANIVLTLERERGNENPSLATEVGYLRQTPAGGTMENISIQGLLDQSAPLQDYEHYCIGCPANALSKPFGCYGSIAYPISGLAEQWLMDRLPGDLDSTAGQYLRASIADFGYDGGSVRDMRRHDMFFERRKPVQRTWRTGLLRRWTLTSDQLLQMMIGLGDIGAAHCGMLALFFGVVPHDTPRDLVRDRAAWRELVGQARAQVNAGEPQLDQWVSFLSALATAVALDVRLLIDS
jgi:hypothetical protein